VVQEGNEGGADRLVSQPVEPAAAGQVDRAEDGAPPVGAWDEHALAGAVAIQVERTRGSRLMWVSSSASTTDPPGSSVMVWRTAATTWSASGSPLTASRGRRQQASSRTRRCRVGSDQSADAAALRTRLFVAQACTNDRKIYDHTSRRRMSYSFSDIKQ
jgi:hypothetical protein